MTTPVLHPDFVKALRHAWIHGHTDKWWVARLFGKTESGRRYRPRPTEWRRLRLMAEALHYDGPILADETETIQ